MITPSRSLALHSWYFYTAAVLLVSICAWVTGIPGFIQYAEAAQLTGLRDTLSTSAPGVEANHTVVFATPSGIIDDGSTVTLTFPNGFDLSAITEDDIDVAEGGVDLTTDTTCGAVEAAVNVASQTLTIELCNGGGGTIAPASAITIEIGTNATSSGTGINQITNHSSAGSYEFAVRGTMADEGYTRLVIVDQVLVTGRVDTYLDFSVTGVNAGQTVNADASLTFATTTATTVSFGMVSPDTEYVLAQDLSVTTNAKNGYMVTVVSDSDLMSPLSGDINSFMDGTDTSVPTTWTPPSAVYSNSDTYGHWGVTTEDASLSDNDSFGNALYVGNFINTPREVMYATSSADGTTPHVGATRVGYKLEISVMQEAANDYTTTLTYVATPVF